jgi:1-acyl-sn-glycerol-3-phosphate acyltransferase
VPVALNSGLFWPRRSFRRYPGTIVIEILEPVAPGLPRAEARKLIEERIETACARLIAEAGATPDPPPLPAQPAPAGGRSLRAIGSDPAG